MGALTAAVARGTSYGAPSPLELDLARLIQHFMPAIELLRFVNAGTKATMSVLGRVIGGGLPVGANGGQCDSMEMVAPSGPVYQAGTWAGNRLAMTAGIETLRELQAAGVWEVADNQAG